MKICTNCRIEKPLDNFGFQKKGKKWLKSWCKQCHADFGKIYRQRAERKLIDYERTRIVNINKYGISVEEREKMLIAQNGSCKICNKSEKEFAKNLAIDHCHITGRVRGLLCVNCNSGLGKFMDDINLLNEAIKYLSI